MAMNKIVVGMDNRVQSGDQSVADIVAELTSMGVSGHSVASQVRDPITGKLIQVTLTFPDTANAQAADAVNANRGVATATIPLPPALTLVDVTGVNSAVILKGDGVSYYQVVGIYQGDITYPVFGLNQVFGYLKGNNVVNNWVDSGTTGNPFFGGILGLHNQDAASLIFTNDQIRIDHDGVQTFLKATGNIVAPPPILPGLQTQAYWWIGADGKLYPGNLHNGQHTIFSYSYEQAVALGAV